MGRSSDASVADPRQELEAARLLWDKGDGSAALARFGQIIHTGADADVRQAAYVGAGNVHLVNAEYGRATRCYKSALAISVDPDMSAEALHNLATVLYLVGDKPAAFEMMQQVALSDHPTLSPLASDNLRVLFGTGLYAHSEEGRDDDRLVEAG